jgi:type II secretory pathway pseudopilin PulG
LTTPASTAASPDRELPTLRGLVARHKAAAAAVAAVIAVMLAIIVVPVLGAKARAVSDATTCTQWGAANQNQQAAYARLYVREHGPLTGGATSPSSVIAAINNGCAQAYGEDVSDTTTVVQAISGKF